VDSIFLSRGIPSPDILPVEQLSACARTVLAREARTLLNYGPAGGYPPLRAWLAEQHGVAASRIIISTGSLTGFNFLARHLFRDGGRAIVEAPAYDRTLVALQAAGAAIDSVALDDAGLDLDRLETLLGSSSPPKLLYTVPTFQNPSGRTLALEQRKTLVALARRHGVPIYEDDPYRLVRYSGSALPSLYELAEGEGVVFSTSFSKTCAPGLRVGYLVLPEALVKPIEALAASTYIGPPPLPQAIVHEFIQGGHFEPALATVCGELRLRRDAMLGALQGALPADAAFSHPHGGYFLWLDLPANIDGRELTKRAAAAGVEVVPGADFYVDGGGAHALRLAFSFPAVAEIEEGVGRLAALIAADA
jgi:DNA-binding transcriptional MocR family regulator